MKHSCVRVHGRIPPCMHAYCGTGATCFPGFNNHFDVRTSPLSIHSPLTLIRSVLGALFAHQVGVIESRARHHREIIRMSRLGSSGVNINSSDYPTRRPMTGVNRA